MASDLQRSNLIRSSANNSATRPACEVFFSDGAAFSDFGASTSVPLSGTQSRFSETLAGRPLFLATFFVVALPRRDEASVLEAALPLGSSNGFADFVVVVVVVVIIVGSEIK